MFEYEKGITLRDADKVLREWFPDDSWNIECSFWRFNHGFGGPHYSTNFRIYVANKHNVYGDSLAACLMQIEPKTGDPEEIAEEFMGQFDGASHAEEVEDHVFGDGEL